MELNNGVINGNLASTSRRFWLRRWLSLIFPFRERFNVPAGLLLTLEKPSASIVKLLENYGSINVGNNFNVTASNSLR